MTFAGSQAASPLLSPCAATCGRSPALVAWKGQHKTATQLLLNATHLFDSGLGSLDRDGLRSRRGIEQQHGGPSRPRDAERGIVRIARAREGADAAHHGIR